MENISYYEDRQAYNPLARKDSNPFASFLPAFFFYGMIFYIPFFEWRQFGGVKMDWVLMGGVLFFIFANLFYVRKKAATLSSPLNILFLLFFVVNILATLFTPYYTEAIAGLVTLVLAFVFITVSNLMITDRGYQVTLPVVVCLSISLNALLAVIGYYLGLGVFLEGGEERGLGGTYTANDAAYMCLFLLPLLVHGLAYAQSRFVKFSCFLLILLNIFGVITTHSRGGFLGMILILAFLAWRHRHFMTPKRFGVVFMLTCLVAVTVIASVPQAYVDRLLTLKKGVSMESDTAMQRRSRYIVVAFDSFKNNPILGTGTDTFGTVWQYSKEAIKFKMSSRDAHNTYLEVLVGSGLLGLVLFFVIIVKSYRNFVHAERIFARIGNNVSGHLKLYHT